MNLNCHYKLISQVMSYHERFQNTVTETLTKFAGEHPELTEIKVLEVGTGTGLTSSSLFQVIPSSGSYNTLSATSYKSSIIGGYTNTIDSSESSSIIGGNSNNICTSSINSVIIGSSKSTIDNSYKSIILGSVKSSINTTSIQSSIISGDINKIYQSSFSSIIGGSNNIMDSYSNGSVIIGGTGLTLSSESEVVYVPKLKIATASNIEASRLLVWDIDNYVKYRDVSSISGGSGTQGPTGPQGEIGPQGLSGPQGNTGPSGESTVVLLTDGALIDTDASLGNVFYVTLGGNRTLSNPTNPTSGKRIIWRIKQDATGGRTITLDTKFRLGTDITSVVLSTAPSITDYIGAIYNAQDDKWDVIAFVKGFA